MNSRKISDSVEVSNNTKSLVLNITLTLDPIIVDDETLFGGLLLLFYYFSSSGKGNISVGN